MSASRDPRPYSSWSCPSSGCFWSPRHQPQLLPRKPRPSKFGQWALPKCHLPSCSLLDAKTKALSVLPVSPIPSWCHPTSDDLCDSRQHCWLLSRDTRLLVFDQWAVALPGAILPLTAFETQDTSHNCLAETQGNWCLAGWSYLFLELSFLWQPSRPKTPVVIASKDARPLVSWSGSPTSSWHCPSWTPTTCRDCLCPGDPRPCCSSVEPYFFLVPSNIWWPLRPKASKLLGVLLVSPSFSWSCPTATVVYKMRKLLKWSAYHVSH